MDWNSFWVNIFAGSIYFILGIFCSIWLIPKFTIRLLKRKNIIHFRIKITFIISEICEFLNRMPKEFKNGNDSTTFLVQNSKFSDLDDFVALLNPNILKPAGPEQLKVNILKTIQKCSGEERFVLLNSEIERLKKLQTSFENILASHILNIDDELISSLSSLCIDIRRIINEFEYNYVSEKLTGKKEGIHGANRLDKIYDKIIDLLRLLEKENGIKRE